MILLRVRLRERAAEHGEVLGEQINRAAVDRAPAGDDAVAGDLGLLHAEVVGAVLDEHVELLERALVEQQFDALARGQFAALVLGLDARLAAAETGVLPPLLEFVENVFHGPFSPCPLLGYRPPPEQKPYHAAFALSSGLGRKRGPENQTPPPAFAPHRDDELTTSAE